MDKVKLIKVLVVIAGGLIMYDIAKYLLNLESAAKRWKDLNAIPPIDLRRYRITSRFGFRAHPVFNKVLLHNGIDIACPVGTPIVSSYPGYVRVWENRLGGLQLALYDHTGKLRLGFAHLSDVFVSNGDTVDKGWMIATTGNSGTTTGPHLHLTVSYDRMWLDPVEFFKKVGVL